MIEMDLKKIEDILNDNTKDYELILLPEDLPLDVSSHVTFHGISMKDAVPTLIYRTENGLVAVQKRADTKINAQQLKDLLGVKRLSLASPDELHSVGTDVGIVPLVGLALPYFIDKKVLENEEIYGGSGIKTYAIKMRAKDLQKINNATIGSFTELDNAKKRILTGDTPTGKLHVGHYVGTLENRVKLQEEYETFIILADTHALTTLNQQADVVRQHTLQVLLDNLSVGLNPEKVTFFAESEIPELYELAALFSMYVSHNRALRNPTIKDEIKMKGLGDQFSLGFVNYPIYQAADILCVKGELVPVGKDQEAHLEQTREIAEMFNKMAHAKLHRAIFPEPQALIGRVGKLMGTDGSPKMSKSLGNTIYLSETPEEVEKKVMNMYTDPTRLKATDPGHVEGNPVFAYLDAFSTASDKEKIAEYKVSYERGTVGDVEVKKYLVDVMNKFLEPIRERRKTYDDEKILLDILHRGNQKVQEETHKTLSEVKETLGIVY